MVAPHSKESLQFPVCVDVSTTIAQLHQVKMLSTMFINKYLIDFKELTFNTWDPTFVGDLLEREDRLKQSSKKNKSLNTKLHVKQSLTESSFTVNVYLMLHTSKVNAPDTSLFYTKCST